MLVGFPQAADRTWEPEGNTIDQSVIRDFEAARTANRKSRVPVATTSAKKPRATPTKKPSPAPVKRAAHSIATKKAARPASEEGPAEEPVEVALPKSEVSPWSFLLGLLASVVALVCAAELGGRALLGGASLISTVHGSGAGQWLWEGTLAMFYIAWPSVPLKLKSTSSIITFNLSISRVYFWQG